MLLNSSRQRRHPRRGMVAVMVALCLTVLVGMVALTMDGGLAQSERRHAQAVADAAALAAATDTFANINNLSGPAAAASAVASARDVAQANGYTHGSNATVTVNIPPTDGSPYFTGNPFFADRQGYVEVIVEFDLPRAFSSIWGSDPIPIRARAVAQGGWRFIPAIVVLDPSASGAFRIINSFGSIRVLLGGVHVNSTSPLGARHQTESDFYAPEYSITGNFNHSNIGRFRMSGGAEITSSSTGRPPIPDPLTFLPVPDPAALLPQLVPSPTTGPAGEQIYNLQPGRYVGGIQIPQENGITKVVNLAPGRYYMEGGGFRFESALGSLTGTGVTIYNAPTGPSDPINIDSVGTVTLSPPTSGPYKDITFFQERSSAAPINIDSRGSFTITGGFYGANAPMTIRRNDPDVHIGSHYVSRTLTMTGFGDLIIPGFAFQQRVIRLVE